MPRKRIVVILIGVLLILAANFGLRYKLEKAYQQEIFQPEYIYSYGTDIMNFRRLYQTHSWKLLLPASYFSRNPIFKRWSTTGWVVITIMYEFVTPATAFLILNALTILVSFITSWYAFESWVFSFTISLCMAFGTQFSGAYSYIITNHLFLLTIYMEINLLSLYKILKKECMHQKFWKTLFIISLVFLALCWETWLDYFVFLMCLAAFWYFLARNNKHDTVSSRKILFPLLSTLAIAISYITIRSLYIAEHITQGMEAELVFTYPHISLIIEDLISNVFTYIYISFSNFMPPIFISSNSLALLGEKEIIRQQWGFWADRRGILIPMHYIFYWHYYAGAVTSLFFYSLIKNIKKTFQTYSEQYVLITTFMILIATGFSTHLLIKFRGYISAPLQAWKCNASVLGVALLISYLLMILEVKINRKNTYISIVLIAWLIIVSGGFTRPFFLNALAGPVDYRGIIPDPIPAIKSALNSIL